MKILSFTAIALMISFISACSGLKTYDSDLAYNLQISTDTDSGSMLTGIRTAVDIHKVNPDCTTEYAGTVKLDEETSEIGIPPGRSTYLVFVFEKSGLFSASTSTSYDTLIRPRTGYQYTAKVSYHDNIYNVLLNEIEPGKKQGRKISTRNMKTCRPV